MTIGEKEPGSTEGGNSPKGDGASNMENTIKPEIEDPDADFFRDTDAKIDLDAT